jgi:hypothetical protein
LITQAKYVVCLAEAIVVAIAGTAAAMAARATELPAMSCHLRDGFAVRNVGVRRLWLSELPLAVMPSSSFSNPGQSSGIVASTDFKIVTSPLQDQKTGLS